jgi:hypothetical protein
MGESERASEREEMERERGREERAVMCLACVRKTGRGRTALWVGEGCPGGREREGRFLKKAVEMLKKRHSVGRECEA